MKAKQGRPQMLIASVSVALPSRKVSNEEVVEEVRSRSKGFDGDLDRTIRVIRTMLKRSGSVNRLWCNEEEKPFNLVLRACEMAIEKLPSADRKIDLVIHAGVYRELLEPSTASLIANRLGLFGATAFDIVAACDGFMIAAEQAQMFLAAGKKRILVVNGEFPMTPGFAVYPQNFQLKRPEDAESIFPSYTLGEGASAVILENGGSPWPFHRKERHDLVELCTLTGHWQNGKGVKSDQIGPAGTFRSYGAKLWEHGHPEVVNLYRSSGIRTQMVDHLFTHASSLRDWMEIASDIGLERYAYDIYARTGNLVSASVPAAMAMAEDEGTLHRKDNVVLLVGSAGMSFSVTEFTH